LNRFNRNMILNKLNKLYNGLVKWLARHLIPMEIWIMFIIN